MSGSTIEIANEGKNKESHLKFWGKLFPQNFLNKPYVRTIEGALISIGSIAALLFCVSLFCEGLTDWYHINTTAYSAVAWFMFFVYVIATILHYVTYLIAYLVSNEKKKPVPALGHIERKVRLQVILILGALAIAIATTAFSVKWEKHYKGQPSIIFKNPWFMVDVPDKFDAGSYQLATHWKMLCAVSCFLWGAAVLTTLVPYMLSIIAPSYVSSSRKDKFL